MVAYGGPTGFHGTRPATRFKVAVSRAVVVAGAVAEVSVVAYARPASRALGGGGIPNWPPHSAWAERQTRKVETLHRKSTRSSSSPVPVCC